MGVLSYSSLNVVNLKGRKDKYIYSSWIIY